MPVTLERPSSGHEEEVSHTQRSQPASSATPKTTLVNGPLRRSNRQPFPNPTDATIVSSYPSLPPHFTRMPDSAVNPPDSPFDLTDDILEEFVDFLTLLELVDHSYVELERFGKNSELPVLGIYLGPRDIFRPRVPRRIYDFAMQFIDNHFPSHDIAVRIFSTGQKARGTGPLSSGGLNTKSGTPLGTGMGETTEISES